MKAIKYPERRIDLTNPVNLKYLQRWRKSDAYWFQDCVFTVDEARAQLAKIDPTIFPVRKFPIEEECYRLLLGTFRTENVLWILKSRRLLITWLCCGYLLKNACFTPNSNNFIIQQNLSAGDKLLKKRCMFMYNNIPTRHWDEEYQCYVNLRDLHPYVHPTRYILRIPELNSSIEAVASGEHKIRGETGSIIFWDEIAFNGNILQTWEALYYVKKGGGQIIGATTWFDNDWEVLWNGVEGSANLQIV